MPISILLLAFALYWPALRIFFSLDDLQFLMKAAGLDENPFGLRRLVSVRLFFTAAWRLFGGTPWPYHAVAILIHAANGWLVYLLSRRMGLRQAAAGAASILFVAAPVAFMPLHWISGIQEISMTFFALLAAYAYLGRGYVSMSICLASALLSVLCKESSMLLLPVMAAVIPVSRRRRVILGIGGLLIAAAVLRAAGGLTPRPEGDPYETAIGINILWNLLTYTAWLARIWDYFPDRIPEYQAGIAGWGLIVPLLIGIAALRIRKAARPLARASLISFFLLLPVLPLVRHSYFYYLYLPIVPFWLLAGAGLAGIPRRSIAMGILVLFIFYSAFQGIRHRRAEIMESVREDPVLRYAEMAGNAVSAFRSESGVMQDDLLVLTSAAGDRVDLAAGVRGSPETGRTTFLMVERALIGGRALKLFFPAVRSVTFQTTAGESPGWKSKHLYWTYGSGNMKYLGYGEEGLFKLVNYCMSGGKYDRAEIEVGAMLELRPDNPNLYLILGDIALKQGDRAKLAAVIEKLETLAAAESRPGMAAEALRALKRMAAPPPGGR